jgi:hypothetical protein
VTVAKPVKRATAFFCGLGWSELAIDGQRVDDALMTPGFTTYDKRTQYLVLDVTDRLSPGSHTLDVTLLDGWYVLERDPWGHGFHHQPDFAADRLGRYVPAPGLGESSVVAYLNPKQAAELMPKIRAGLERLPADYAALLAPHAKVHGELMGRVSLDLGGGEDRRQSTDELLARSVRDGSLPPALMERMYDGCRYLAICSSGEVVPNLQGIWTGTWTPAWSGDWTLDSNLQLAMNSMCSANLVEFMEPYARLLESWVPDMRINARKVYGARPCTGCSQRGRRSTKSRSARHTATSPTGCGRSLSRR